MHSDASGEGFEIANACKSLVITTMTFILSSDTLPIDVYQERG